MALCLISYDINHKNESEYPDLWASLKRWGAVKILFSEWIGTGDMGSGSSIYKELSLLIKQNDRLLVQEIGRDCAWDRLLISDETFRQILIRTLDCRF
jgi:hypothetical protein